MTILKSGTFPKKLCIEVGEYYSARYVLCIPAQNYYSPLYSWIPSMPTKKQ